MTSSPDTRPIVVGIDPDPTQWLALAWAADEAGRRRLPLRLVHARRGTALQIPDGGTGTGVGDVGRGAAYARHTRP
ncbi:universal stress protein [Streptomyces sp. NPDC051917]|uniref:universal stress protein n=1 Tax=Streptomyces sp. NPDC051917 TaxID=3154754 RepID=UPI003455C5D2